MSISLDANQIIFGKEVVSIYSVLTRYKSKLRHYHNLSHLRRMVYVANNYIGGSNFVTHSPLSVIQEIAILYHDAIYDPGFSGFNETASADLMEHECRSFFPFFINERMINEAREVIIDTINHVCATNEHSGLVLDLDLFDLGAPDDVDGTIFKTNSENIRKEYSMFSDKLFFEGRAKFWLSLLERKRIYHTPVISALCEKRARQNIENDYAECINKLITLE